MKETLSRSWCPLARKSRSPAVVAVRAELHLRDPREECLPARGQVEPLGAVGLDRHVAGRLPDAGVDDPEGPKRPVADLTARARVKRAVSRQRDRGLERGRIGAGT